MNKEKIIYLFIGILILILSIPVKLQSQNTIKKISNIDGLSNNSVNCIFEDSRHTIWIGTWDGLNAYNGRDIKTYRYNKNDKSSISNNIIRQIMEVDSIYLWIATDYGINRLNKLTQTFDNYYLGTEQLIPNQEKSFLLALTSENDIICYVKQQGLFYFDKNRGDFIPIDFHFSSSEAKSFLVDENNTVYFLHEDGKLQSYQLAIKGGISLSEPRYIEQQKHVNNMFLTNNMLILNYDGYLKIVDSKNQYPTAIDVDKRKTISQVIYRNGSILISYYEGGCSIYDLKAKTLSPLKDFPAMVSTFCMYVGSQDILWVGTDGQGILQVYEHHSPFKTMHTNHPVRSFANYENKLLVGTKGEGIKIWNNDSKILSDFLNTNNGLISNSVYALKKNKSNDVFIGTEGEGINILSEGRLSRLKLPNNAPFFKAVYSLYFTNNDSVLWLGTSGYGLIKISFGSNYSITEIKQYKSEIGENGLNNDVIYSIVSGQSENELWLGTRGGGISRLDIEKEKFENINTNISLTSNDVLSLIKDNQDIWVGTSYGLNVFPINLNDISQVKEYTENNGLANNTIHGILEDEKGNIWASTNWGISHIDLDKNIITNYSSKDGLQNDEFSDGAYYKDIDGNFYFGGVNGISYFKPEQINLRSFDPEIGLSNLRIYNNSVNISDRIRNNILNLAYDEAYMTFTFIAKDFINNENCEYSYRLQNFSDEWINNGNNPNIVLTKLPPGTYRLEVKVTNGDRVWGSNVYRLDLDVAYPWWLSAPAIIIYILLLIAIAYIAFSVIKNRIRLNRQLLLEHVEKQNQQKMHESRLNFFTNVAHEFFTPLTLIYGPAQHLLEKSDLNSYEKRYIQIIKNNADRMQKLINELMEFRKLESGHTPLYPENIDIQLLMDYIIDNYTEIASENKIKFTVNTNNISSIITDRNSLEKIIFNLVSNAFKYTPANGYITISASQENENLQISIENSGKGLSDKQMSEIFNRFKIFGSSKLQNSTSTGVGLNLTKSLVELLGGEISVSSELNEYVMFSVIIPPIQSEIKSAGINPEEDIQPLDPAIYQNKNISILIVEDEKNIRELLLDILTPYYHVREAADGREALTAIEQNMPDIIISDVLMPNLDGMGLIDRLKSNLRTAHIPIINISAKNAVEDHIDAYEHGADLYITKPFHPRHVLISIQNLINKHSVLKSYYNSSASSIIVKDGMAIHQDDERLLQEILSFIEKNMDDELLDPNSLADALGLSKATLYRKLKDTTDKTPSELIRTVRLNYAAQLLKTTKLTVQEIMFKSGFTNKSYFFRVFAKQYNSSPKEYRENNR